MVHVPFLARVGRAAFDSPLSDPNWSSALPLAPSQQVRPWTPLHSVYQQWHLRSCYSRYPPPVSRRLKRRPEKETSGTGATTSPPRRRPNRASRQQESPRQNLSETRLQQRWISSINSFCIAQPSDARLLWSLAAHHSAGTPTCTLGCPRSRAPSCDRRSI
jgi:hypothetical protein